MIFTEGNLSARLSSLGDQDVFYTFIFSRLRSEFTNVNSHAIPGSQTYTWACQQTSLKARSLRARRESETQALCLLPFRALLKDVFPQTRIDF